LYSVYTTRFAIAKVPTTLAHTWAVTGSTLIVQMPCINAAQSQPRMESLCLSAYELPIGITEYISNRLGGSTSVKKVIRYIIRIGQKAHPALLLAIKL